METKWDLKFVPVSYRVDCLHVAMFGVLQVAGLPSSGDKSHTDKPTRNGPRDINPEFVKPELYHWSSRVVLKSRPTRLLFTPAAGLPTPQ